MDFYKKYLIYKQKYINLKTQMYGSGDTVCRVCPTKEQAIENLEKIIRQVPENCIKYTFIPDELNERFKKLKFDNSDNSEEYLQLIEEYQTYLKNIFFEGRVTSMHTHHRKIVTDYSKIEKNNNASTTWHQDTEFYSTTFYNILYYLQLENCRADCGTEIAFKNLQSEIINIKLPIMEGLIIALKDDCFTHKSPIISLIDHDKLGIRLIIRTYADYQNSDEIREKNIKLDSVARELNLNKLNSCMEDYVNPSSDQAIKSDCLLFIKHYYDYERSNSEISEIFSKYMYNSKYDSLFEKLEEK